MTRDGDGAGGIGQERIQSRVGEWRENQEQKDDPIKIKVRSNHESRMRLSCQMR